MNSPDVHDLLRDLGCDKIKEGYNSWVNATCPFAQWRHASGQDKQPSFGVSVVPNGASKYKCHACGISGELPYLIFLVQRYTKRDINQLMSFVQRTNAPSVSDLEDRMRTSDSYWQTPTKVAGIAIQPRAMERKVIVPELPILPEDTLKLMQPLPDDLVGHYVGKGFTRRTLQEWEIGWHPGSNRVSIPIRDCEKHLVGVSGRVKPGSDEKPKFMHSPGFRSAFYLYGEHKAPKNMTVHLCEGFFDVIYLWQKGYCAVAMQGTNIGPFQIEKLKKFFKDVVIILDGDKAGRDAADKALGQIGAAMMTRIANVPDGTDPDDLDDEQLFSLLGEPQFNSIDLS